MATNYRYHCPYCARHVKTTSSPVYYGSLLKNCPKCGETYLDPYGKELALKDYHPHSVPKLLISNLSIGSGSAVIIAVIVGLITKNAPVSLLIWGIGTLVFGLLWFFHSMLARDKEESSRLKQWQESDLRLQNAAYATLLKHYGYDVPARYLPADFNPVPESVFYKQAKVSEIHFV